MVRHIELHAHDDCFIYMENIDKPNLHFHRLTFNSLPLIMPYLQRAGSRSCDYTIGGIYMWIDYFKYHYCIYNHTLLIKGVAEDDVKRTAFSLPLGDMPLDECVKLLKSYCRQQEIPLVFSAITDEHIDDFRSLHPKEITKLDHWSDYVYDAEKLATLAGNKLKKKRNHVNKFLATYPDHHIATIDSSNLNDVRQFFDQLCSAKDDNGMAGYERNQTRKVLSDYCHFANIFEGIALYVDSRIVAFSIGEINGRTLHVHIEKTDHSFDGANEFINMAFVQYMRSPHDFDMVNREDDAGDDGLRQAKESYHPALLLKKYNVVF